jgi:hypothetical protein
MHAPRKAIALGGALAAFAMLATPARAEVTEWDHNGSMVRLELNDKKVRLVYAQPRDGLGNAGVKSGTVLFDGEVKTDGRYSGYAKLFRKGCEPVDYYVEGSRDNGKGEILLQGQSPVYAGEGCKITGYTDEGSASSLKFTRSGPSGGVYAGGDLDQGQPSERPSYLPPPSISGERNGGSNGGGYSDPRNDPQDPAYTDPNPRGQGPAYGSRDPAYNEPEERNYADQRERQDGQNRYDGAYNPPYGREDHRDYDAEDDDYYDDEPAYIPYQPGWRRY